MKTSYLSSKGCSGTLYYKMEHGKEIAPNFGLELELEWFQKSTLIETQYSKSQNILNSLEHKF